MSNGEARAPMPIVLDLNGVFPFRPDVVYGSSALQFVPGERTTLNGSLYCPKQD